MLYQNGDNVKAFLKLVRRDFEIFIMSQLLKQKPFEDCVGFYKSVPFWNLKLNRLIEEQKFKLMNNLAG